MTDLTEKPHMTAVPVLKCFTKTLGAIPQEWKTSLTIFLTGRLLFSFWGWVIWRMQLMPQYQGPYYFNITPILEGLPGALLGMWQRWDGIHYQRIATYGYTDADLTAFFPLYPFLARGLSAITGISPLVTLIIVSNLAFLLSLVLLYRLTEEGFSSETAGRTLFTLLVYPCSFFFYSVYPQALLLLWVVMVYWSARRGKWKQACLASLLAGLTHPTGVAVSALIALEALNALRRREKGRFFILAAPVANLVSMAGYFFWRELAGFGNYLSLQNDVGNRSLHLPWQGLSAAMKYILQLPFELANAMDWISVLMLVIILASTVFSVRKLPSNMILYLLASLCIFSCSIADHDPLLGVLRYPLVMFPLFIWMAQVRLPKGLELIKFGVFVLVNLICTSAFFMWKGGVS